MSRTTPDDQLKFLLSCVRNSNNGRVEFSNVANECGIVSKGAAAKRYERLLKGNGISPSGGPVEPGPAKGSTTPKPKQEETSGKAPRGKKRKERSLSVSSDHNAKAAHTEPAGASLPTAPPNGTATSSNANPRPQLPAFLTGQNGQSMPARAALPRRRRPGAEFVPGDQRPMPTLPYVPPMFGYAPPAPYIMGAPFPGGYQVDQPPANYTQMPGTDTAPRAELGRIQHLSPNHLPGFANIGFGMFTQPQPQEVGPINRAEESRNLAGSIQLKNGCVVVVD